ncbi:MAG: PatB family C-S lyase [Chloroflexota bacterium]
MDFDEIIDRRSTESLKWRLYNEDVLPLWVADMDFRCPQAVMDALNKRVSHGVFGYGLVPDDLPTIIVERMKRLFQWDITEEDVCFIPGVVTGLNLTMRALCKPGDAVMVQTPVYPPILSAPIAAGLIRVDNSLIQNDDGTYRVDYKSFESQIVKNNVKLFILCNPHNPVGKVFKRDELLRMADICLKHNVIVCSDDIHCDLIFSEHKHIPIASLHKNISANTITFLAPSKTYNIAGLHASMGIIQDAGLREIIMKTRKGLISNPGLLSLTAARAAYLHGDAWLADLMYYLEENRDWLVSVVRENLPGIKMIAPEGTFLAWLDCRSVLMDVNPHEFFLQKARVGLNDGAAFGSGGDGFLRFNFASPRSMLEEAIIRMRKAMQAEGLL